MRRKAFIAGAAMALALSLTACGGEAVTKTMDSLNQEGQTSAEGAACSLPERTVTGTIRLDGQETLVYLEVSDTGINFWDSASGGKLLAAAEYPKTLDGAADALQSCGYTDLDEDGSGEITAEFTFADGSEASLVWFYADGGLAYNEEFSRLPGEVNAAGSGGAGD